jgi:hypothetical protein
MLISMNMQKLNALFDTQYKSGYLLGGGRIGIKKWKHIMNNTHEVLIKLRNLNIYLLIHVYYWSD